MKEAYTTIELMLLLALVKTSVLRRAEREGWQSRSRKGRGGGKEWLTASMPLTTRSDIQTAEIRLAHEQEKALTPAPPSAPLALSHPDYSKRILEDKRRNGALAKADLLRHL